MIRSINQQAAKVAMAALSGFILGMAFFVLIEFTYLWGTIQ